MIAAKLEDLRRELLDLTRRNRLLHQGMQDHSVLDLLDVDADRVRAQLLDKRQKLSFFSREEATPGHEPGEEAEEAEEAEGEARGETGQIEGDAGPLAPLDGPLRGQAHEGKPQGLQTRLEGQKLQARLLRLDREARHAFEDQGINRLYLSFGTVVWKGTGADDVPSRAPLLFLPVELTRRHVKSRHRIHAFDDDLETNPVLSELCRQSFGFEMPQYDASRHPSLAEYYQVLREAISGLDSWELIEDSRLGLYSFAELLMYRDLDPEQHGERLNGHPLIQLLCDNAATEGQTPAGMLDQLDPREASQVLDADSSQQAAMLAARQGQSFVLEGPPGTGKSQTITNIIAAGLADGKSILFVSKKAAALDCVHRQLDSLGLGRFVLPLHGRKACQRALPGNIQSALKSQQDLVAQSEKEPGALIGTGQELIETGHKLNAYSREIQTPIGVLRWSPYRCMSRAIRLAQAPEAPCRIPGLLEMDQSLLLDLQARIRRLDHRISRIGNPEKHAWRGSRLREARLDLRQALKLDLPALDGALARAHAHCNDLAALLGRESPDDFESIDALLNTAGFLLGMPKLEREWLESETWVRRWKDFLAWLQDGRDRQALVEKWAEVFEPTAEEEDWTALHERWRAHKDSLWRFLRPSWYRDRRLLHHHALRSLEEANESLPLLIRSRELRERLTKGESEFGGRLGRHWTGLNADFGELEELVLSIHRIREKIQTGRLGLEAALSILVRDDRREVKEARERASKSFVTLRNAWRDLAARLQTSTEDWFGAPWSGLGFAAFASRMEGLASDLEGLQDWTNFQSSVSECQDEATEGFLEWALSKAGIVGRGRLESCFLRQVYRLFLDESLDSLPNLRNFSGIEHQDCIQRFRELDRLWIQHDRNRLCQRIQERWPSRPTSEHGRLDEQIQGVLPCFMMSPASVAQLLGPSQLDFDLVIFDEATQIEPSHALGAISRGKQLILVGDEKLLPPTSLFCLGKARLPHRTRLQWHYRSRHESLIDFSVSRFYDHDLRVFPSPHRSRTRLGLEFHYTRDAVYLRGKAQYNPLEAREIAGRVIEHTIADPHLSLGVGAFSLLQQRAIEDEIERFRRESDDPRIEAFFLAHEHEPFFVKNLETIQGDERDVILLSVGYGRDEFGELSMDFGALNREEGWRSLNVLITRARMKCEIFSSIRSADIDVSRTESTGVRALKDYLYYAEHGLLPGIDAPRSDHDSPFEAEVCKVLQERGYTVHAQVGSAGFSIDLAIVHPAHQDSYLCGIECDGATYHSAPTARDRDRLRQEVLTNLGWRILRVWSSDWFRSPRSTCQKLISEIEELLTDEPLHAEEEKRPELPGPEASKPEPYQSAALGKLGTIEELGVARPEEIAAFIVQIVEAEGPVHLDRALRVLAGGYDTRATRRPREIFKRGMLYAQSQGQLFARGEFLWPKGLTRARIRYRGENCPVTETEHIAPEELQEAIQCVLEMERGLPAASVVESTRRWLGFKRSGKKLNEALEKACDALTESGRISCDQTGYLTPQAPSHEH